ncbi:hypothetical protein [Neobacillus cucumis]|nr:hypothetical protein [Neobacillus cucumis]MDR4946984.1 hypothetical protein [Neobacillus cucumis]
MDINQQYQPAKLSHSELEEVQTLENRLRTEMDEELIVIAYTKKKSQEN